MISFLYGQAAGLEGVLSYLKDFQPQWYHSGKNDATLFWMILLEIQLDLQRHI